MVQVTATATSSWIPTGSVNLSRGGGIALGSATLVNGQTVLTIADLPPGSHTITAIYSGDSLFNGSTGTTGPVLVNYFLNLPVLIK